MGVLGFYVLIPVAPCKMVEWFNATELCHIFQAIWVPGACLCMSSKFFPKKIKFWKLGLTNMRAVQNPFIFHDLMGKTKTAADISGPFLLLTHYWFPHKIKTCPLTYFLGYLFWPPLAFCTPGHEPLVAHCSNGHRWKEERRSFPTVCKTIKSVDVCPPKLLHKDKKVIFWKLAFLRKLNIFGIKLHFFGKFHSIGASGRVSGMLTPSFVAIARRWNLGSKRDSPPFFKIPFVKLWFPSFFFFFFKFLESNFFTHRLPL